MLRSIPSLHHTPFFLTIHRDQETEPDDERKRLEKETDVRLVTMDMRRKVCGRAERGRERLERMDDGLTFCISSFPAADDERKKKRESESDCCRRKRDR